MLKVAGRPVCIQNISFYECYLVFSARSVCRLNACKVSMSIVLSVCSFVILVSELCIPSSNRALVDLSPCISSFIYIRIK